MKRIRNVHHVNFIYRDLDAAIDRFERLLDIGPFQREDLPERGVRTARALIGETWIVLVSPTRADTVPGRYLAEHGEGFFLLSFGVDDIDRSIAALRKRDPSMTVGEIRDGAGHWKIADLPTGASLGVLFQLTEDPDAD